MSVMKLGPRFDFLEWLILHPGAVEVEGAPEWVYKYSGIEETGSPHFRYDVRHRSDGREFTFRVGLWTRGEGFKYPMAMSNSGMILIELHERYPEEYPDDPHAGWDEPQHPLDIALNDAFDAFLAGDMELFGKRIHAAKQIVRPDTPAEDDDA